MCIKMSSAKWRPFCSWLGFNPSNLTPVYIRELGLQTTYSNAFSWKICRSIQSSLKFLTRTLQTMTQHWIMSLQWRLNECNGVSNHQPHDCLLKRLFRRRSKKASTLCVTGLCEGNSPVTGEFPAQRASDAENVSIWWRHHAMTLPCDTLA